MALPALVEERHLETAGCRGRRSGHAYFGKNYVKPSPILAIFRASNLQLRFEVCPASCKQPETVLE
jgi:hypothetical protein